MQSKKMLTAGTAIILLMSLFSITPASASSLSSCLMITNPKANISGQQVSISADVYQTCKTYTPGSGSISVLAFLPSYSVNLSGVTCTGPMLKSELLSLPLLGYVLGNVRCSGTTSSFGTSRSTISASNTDGLVSLSFSHTLISAPVIVKPTQTTPAQTTPAQTTPAQTTPAQTTPTQTTPTQTTPTQTTPAQTTPAQTTPVYVESPVTTAALKDLDDANNQVETAIKLADSAASSAQKMSESLVSVLETMQALLDQAKARIASLIELVQRIQSKSSVVR